MPIADTACGIGMSKNFFYLLFQLSVQAQHIPVGLIGKRLSQKVFFAEMLNLRNPQCIRTGDSHDHGENKNDYCFFHVSSPVVLHRLPQ